MSQVQNSAVVSLQKKMRNLCTRGTTVTFASTRTHGPIGAFMKVWVYRKTTHPKQFGGRKGEFGGSPQIQVHCLRN